MIICLSLMQNLINKNPVIKSILNDENEERSNLRRDFIQY